MVEAIQVLVGTFSTKYEIPTLRCVTAQDWQNMETRNTSDEGTIPVGG